MGNEFYFGFYFSDMRKIPDQEEAMTAKGNYRIYGHQFNDRKEVEIGNDHHHEIFSKGNWNRLVDIITDTSPELNSARALVLDGFMDEYLCNGEYTDRFVEAIKDGRLPKLKY